MDASTLTFPLQALSPRRPDGMIEYALFNQAEQKYTFIYKTVIGGGEVAFTALTMTAEAMMASGESIDACLEAGRATALPYFQNVESGASKQA